MSLKLPSGAVLVAGGSGALGRAICARLAQSGARILVGAATRMEAAHAVASDIRERGGVADAVPLNVSSTDSIAKAISAAERSSGLGTLVYAAGAKPCFDYLSQTDIDEWRRVLELDVFGLIALVKACLPALRKARGSIVTIATFQAQRIELRGGLSTVPKAAAERVMAITAREEARYGVRANTVRAGWIGDGWGASLLTEQKAHAHILQKIPLGRFGAPEEVAEAVAYLASTRASFTTGAVLTVDGGQSL